MNRVELHSGHIDGPWVTVTVSTRRNRELAVTGLLLGLLDMATLLKYFCCCKSLHRGVLVVAQVMPIVSVGMLFYTFTLDNAMEIWLCVTYAVINVGVNLVLLVGCRKKQSLHFLPWLVWVLFCITLSTTFAPVLVYAGIHIEPALDPFEEKKHVRSMKFMCYGGLLLFKSCVDSYFWAGVFSLFREVRRTESFQVSNSPQSECANDTDQEAYGVQIVDVDYCDEPPPYVEALQEMKYSFEFEAPPSYEDALTFTKLNFIQSIS